MLLIPLLVEFLLVVACTGGWLFLARRKGWFDLPNQRSSHTRPTPKSGGAGFAIVYTVFMTWMLMGGDDTGSMQWLIILALGPALIGFLDDLRNLGIVPRMGMQLLVSGAALWLLHPLPDLMLPGIGLPWPWLAPLLLLALVWLINLYNFMDGIDGLAAMEAIFVSLALAMFASMEGSEVITLASLALSVAVSGFLYFNLAPARLFMGDLGSNWLGYMLGVLGLYAVHSGSLNYWTLGTLLSLFIVDATTTLIGRIRAGSLWYHAHRSHAYQHAARRYRSHTKVVFAGVLLNMCWVLPLAWLTLQYEQAGFLIMLSAWLPIWALAVVLRGLPEQEAHNCSAVVARHPCRPE